MRPLINVAAERKYFHLYTESENTTITIASSWWSASVKEICLNYHFFLISKMLLYKSTANTIQANICAHREQIDSFTVNNCAAKKTCFVSSGRCEKSAKMQWQSFSAFIFNLFFYTFCYKRTIGESFLPLHNKHLSFSGKQ